MRNTTLNPWRCPLKGSFSHWRSFLAAMALMPLFAGNLHATATVTSLGGGSTSQPFSGYVEGNTWSTAKFAMPTSLALDPSGTFLFVADYTNSAIRLVSNVGDHASSTTI